MKRIVTALAAVALLTGCGAAVEASAPPVKTITATPATAGIQEDDPGWDCLTMGNRICGANPIQRTEAWGAFQVGNVPEETRREAFRVTYRGYAMQGIDFPPSEYVTAKSQLSPGMVHVFQFEDGTK